MSIYRKNNLQIDPSIYLTPEKLARWDELSATPNIVGDDKQELKELEEEFILAHRRAVIEFELETITAQHPVYRFEEVKANSYPVTGDPQLKMPAWLSVKATDGYFMLLLCDRENRIRFDIGDEFTVGRRRFRVHEFARACQDYAEKIGPHHDIQLAEI